LTCTHVTHNNGDDSADADSGDDDDDKDVMNYDSTSPTLDKRSHSFYEFKNVAVAVKIHIKQNM